MTVPDAPLHVIRRQVLDVDVRGTEADGLALQRRLPDVCSSLVTPAVERALDRCDPGVGWLVVERLDVDVGRLSLDDLERDLPEAIGRAVESFLRNHAPAARSPTPASPSGDATPAGVRRRTDGETADDALVFFLRTGRLPWSFRLPAGRSLEDVVLAAWTAAGRPDGPGPTRRAALLDALAAPAARRRLVAQFSPPFRATLLRQLEPGRATAVDAVLAVLVGRAAAAGEVFRARLWEVAFAGPASGPSTEPAGLVAAAWRDLPPDAPDRPTVRAALARRWPAAVDQATPRPGAPALPADTADRPLEQPEPDPDRPERPRSAARAPGPLDDEDVEDGVHLDNAGLVLLHPFLPRLFEALGVSAGDALIRPERALCLLHLLATGEVTAPEYELVLPKVLCGLPVGEPVPAVRLTEAEIEEAGALLEAAIRHWEALRGTGPEAFRGTFLMRPGMLSPDEDGDWLLRVEEQTVDILLDQLPWGISMIRLPWMRRMLRVEWR